MYNTTLNFNHTEDLKGLDVAYSVSLLSASIRLGALISLHLYVPKSSYVFDT